MPKMVKLAANPAFKPATDADKAALAAAKAKGPVEYDYVTAMENVANGNGLYAIAPDVAETQSMAPRRLEDMSLEELKVMMLSLGIKTEKQMRRADVERLIRSRMAEIDIVEEE